MQVIMKITERQRKSKAGLKQLFNYISRDNFKCAGVGVSDNKEIAFKQFLINKSLFGKDIDNKNRFTYHQILSFGAEVDKETVFKITEEYCQKNFLEKGFNSFFAIHTDTNNIHCHIVADNVNFKTGKMLQSLTEKQYNKEVRKQNKEEVYTYEKQREIFEDICISNGLDITDKERYKSMHEEKEKEGRKWLNKEQYRAIKDKDSWRNIIKNKLEEIYKRVDLTEDNIKEIAKEYQLEVTRHNTKNKTITFALVDLQGKPTKERIKLERLEEQESELNRSKDKENIFEYNNFFKDREKEKQQEEERKREQEEKIRKEQEEKARLEQEKIKRQQEERARAEAEEKARLEQQKKEAEAEKERLERIEKAKLEEFYRKQQEEKEKEIARQKALEEELKEKARAEAEARANAEKERLRLEQEEIARQQEAKAKREAEEKARLERERQAELERIRLEQEERAREQEAKAKREQEQNNEEDKSVGTDELTPNIKIENETSKKVSNNQPTEITEFETGKSVSKCLPTDNEDLEKSIKKLSNNYPEIIKKYNLYENLPAFKIYNENGSEIFNNKTGYIAEDYIISIVGQEYWDNMDINNIKDWENLGVIIAYGNDENEYIDYTDYAEETVINYLKSNPGKVKELELEFNSQLSTPGKSNKIQEEEKEIEKDDKEISI